MNVTLDFERDSGFVSNAVAQLQTIAAAFSRSLPAAHAAITLRVVHVAGAASAWRLIETMRSTNGRGRRMLCFDSMDQIRRCLDEHVAWQRADEQFVARHMATPGGFPGVTADWVHSKDFDSILGPSRHAMRNELCVTSARHVVMLA